MVAEARLAELAGEAREGLSEQIAAVLSGLGLPTRVPDGLSADRVIQAMQLDKKRRGGKVHFALPVDIGKVKWDEVVEDWQDCLKKVILAEEGKE
jgi:3-dehydroquinate synthase